jgi:hypothetical protein
MFRRHITISLIIAHFASQLAAMPHAHGVGENLPSDHDARPHFHLSWFGNAGHSHGHEQAHSHDGGHSHHQHGGVDLGGSQPGSSALANGPLDHDHDAIYLSSETAATRLVRCDGSADNRFVTPLLAVAADIESTATLLWNSGGLVLGRCRSNPPLYLTLRALRI